MRISAVSHFTVRGGRKDSQLTICQKACGVSAIAQAAVLLPLIVAVVVPSTMLAAEAVANPAIWDRLSTSPVNALGALVGVGIWLAMFGIPSWRAMQRLGWILDIEIKDRTVAVRERSLLGTRSWHCPLEQFEGISHHVRTSLSGTRHELVLIHPERERSLLVHMAETISKNETDAFAQRFGLATLSPGLLFQRNSPPCLPGKRFPAAMEPQSA